MLFETKKSEKVDSNKLKDGTYYDVDYYSGKKSNWLMPYEWKNFKTTFMLWAKFIFEGFPESRSFLDVGAAKGFLLKALLEIALINNFEIEVEGFDISEYAVNNCHPDVKEFLKKSSISDYTFKRKFDVIICLDVLEHCFEEDVRAFLKRAHKHCNHALIIALPLEEKENDDPSHILIRPREWWNNLIRSCGFHQRGNWKLFEQLANEEKFIKAAKTNILLYRP